MGGRDSSSKRKSSKKKRDKTSSQKKIRKKQSKKRSQIHGSVSSYSDDSSSNSEHTSLSPSKSDHKRVIHKNKKLRRDYSMSSSSKDHSMSSDSDYSLHDYKLKKARRSKKRDRKRSARPKGDEDALRSRKKRKRSGRDGAPKPKKKSSNKMPKKYSTSYSSSDSESCSTCKSDSSNSTADDSKRKRSKIIIDNDRERRRGRESFNSHKKRKLRSSSCSSIDRGSKHSDVPLSPVNNNNPRRLRSVIAVVDRQYDEGDENRWEMDSHKEEIVYDPNDYPSPKSLDSSEGRNKTELDNQCDGVSSKIIGVETVAGEEIIDRGKSKVKVNEGDQDNNGDLESKAVDMDNFEKGKEIDNSVPVTDLGGDVLESILRQKALENLKKFKKRLQTGPTSTNNSNIKRESNVNMSSDLKVENIQNESTKLGKSNFQEMNQNSGLSQKNDLSQFKDVKILLDSENVEKINRISGPSQKRDLSQLKEVKKLSDSENGEKLNRHSAPSQKRDLSLLKEVKKFSDSENVEKMIWNSGTSRKRDISQFKNLSDSENVERKFGTGTQIVEHPTDGAELLECPEEGKCVSSDHVLTEPVSRINTCQGAETMDAASSSITEPSSSIGPVTEEHSLERENEAKDGSQYEQKTMSVMRGGEMVQVSYKVYIPKKAAALARRPLKR